MKQSNKYNYFINEAKLLQEETNCTWDTALILSMLNSIGYRTYEILNILDKKKKETKKKENR